MIRVLHSVLSLETGGLENGVVNLINSAPQDIQVDVLCLRAGGELIDRITHPNASVILAEGIKSNDHSLKSAVSAHLKALDKYDVLHTHGWSTMLSGCIASYLFPIISLLKKGCLKKRPLIINGEHGVFYADRFRRRLLQKLLFGVMDGNLTVSADLGQRMEVAFKLKSNTFYPILNGVSLEKFKPCTEKRIKIRTQLGLTDKNVLIGSVGRLVTVKNYPLLINAFAQIVQKHPELKLILCGDGHERALLEAQVSQLSLEDSVFFVGRVDNVSDYLQAFDVFALSSDSEGLPNTLLEAMAIGKPAIVTDVGGSREVLPIGGGVLVPPGNLPKYTEALETLVMNEDKRVEMSERARQHIYDNLSIQSMSDAYCNYYRNLMKQKRA